MGNICLFGGTFDPVHNGHLSIADQAVTLLKLDRFIFVPAFIPPHKARDRVTSPKHRLQMLRLAVSDQEDIAVSDYELQQEGVSYTIETVRHFKDKFPEDDILFLTGADSLEHLHLWKEINELLKLCSIIVIPRPGYEFHMTDDLRRSLTSENTSKLESGFIDITTPDISSTGIRAAVANKEGISDKIPQLVAEYITAHNLYTQ